MTTPQVGFSNYGINIFHAVKFLLKKTQNIPNINTRKYRAY